MKYIFTLFTVLTLQLCMLQAREVEAQNVEDHLVDMEAVLADSDLEEDLADSNAMELRARPSKHPFCIRTKRSGWGGQCYDWPELKNQSCDFIWGGDDIVPSSDGKELCQPAGNPVDLSSVYCCVDCKAPKQEENCIVETDVIPKWVGRECLPGEYNLKTMNSGCKCCGKCKRTTFCKRNGGHCVYKYGEDFVDGKPNNYETCEAAGWRLKHRGCEGKTCQCCLPPIET